MTGSTLYRRLPDGTWAAEREDLVAPASAGAASARSQHPPAAPPPGPPPPASPPPGVVQPTVARPVRPRRRWGRTLLRVLKWGAIAYAVWIVGLLVFAALNLQKVDALSPNPIADTDGNVWLLVGSDSRADLSAQEQKELHTGDEEGQRTDTIMIVHMRPGAAPTMASVPRDSWVTIPAHTASDGTEVGPQGAKINAAFAYGGAPLLSETIEYNTGLHVDHYMEVGMGGIVAMTDAVGGIEVCFEEPISDEKSGLDVEAGCQTLDGEQALAWVRMRYSDPTGDIGRMERQQQYVALMMDEILSPQTVLNPFRQWEIVNAVLGSVLVDDGSGSVDLGRLGLGMGRIASGSGQVTSIPVDESDHWENGQWVIHWDEAEANELFASLGGSTPQASTDQ